MESITAIAVDSNRAITSVQNLVITMWPGTEVTTKDTFMEEVELYTTYKIATFINNYWFPFLVPIGLVGNTLSFFVMTKSNNRKMSTCIYMAAISINDNIMMCICFHDYLVSAVQIHNWYDLERKLNAFVILFALQNSTFQILAMTVDKYNKMATQSSYIQYSKNSEIYYSGFVCVYLSLQCSSFLIFLVYWVTNVQPMASVVKYQECILGLVSF